MCFFIGTYDSVKVAKKDLVCWKILTNEFLSPYYPKNKWINNKRQRKVELVVSFSPLDSKIIKKGYHSFIAKKEAEFYKTIIRNTIIVKCIIPAGTRYYQNMYEYVSETLIML